MFVGLIGVVVGMDAATGEGGVQIIDVVLALSTAVLRSAGFIRSHEDTAFRAGRLRVEAALHTVEQGR